MALVLLFASVIVIFMLPHGSFWLSALILSFVPGYLIERWLDLPLHPLARPATWIGLSFAVLVLAYLWLTTAGIGVSLTMIWLAIAGLLAGLAWQWWHNPPHLAWRAIAPLPILATFVALLVFTIKTRIEHIAGLAFPPWVDSVHHATIIRVIAEQGRVPYSLRPYLPIDNFIYHWGYHAFTATVWRTSDLSLPIAMLWFGQYLGVLQVLSLASAITGMTKRPIAGIVAGIVVGFLSVMPAYFLSWGRYTLLTGGVVVPALLYVGWNVRELLNQRGVALLTLLIVGVLPTHFVVAGIGLLWLAAVWLGRDLWHEQRWRVFATLALAVTLAIVFVSPWLATLITQSAPKGAGPRSIQGSNYNTYESAAGLYWTSDNRQLMAASLIGIVILLIKRWRLGMILVIWSGLIVLFANLVWLGLPYLSFFNNNIVALLLYLLFCCAIGGGAAALDDSISTWLHARSAYAVRSWRALRTIGLAAAIVWQGLNFSSVINQATVLAKPDDDTALRWIAQNTPPNARFAINTKGWLYDVSQGSDGGWWLLPYANRHVSTPPVIYTYGSREYIKQVQAQTNWLRDAKNLAPPDIATWMRANGYGYAYATKDGTLFNTTQLAGSSLFEAVYQNDSVGVFRLR